MQGNNPKINFEVTNQKKLSVDNLFGKNTGNFRNNFRIRRNMNHIWMSRQFRALKLSLQRMKPQICDKNVNLHKFLLPNWWRKCRVKLFRKQNLKNDTNQSNQQSLVFSKHLVSFRRNETQNCRFGTFFPIGLSVWTGGKVLLKKKSKTKNIHKQKVWRKTKSIFLEKWIQKVNLKKNDNKKDESYFYSTEKNQSYDLILAILTNWLSIEGVKGH